MKRHLFLIIFFLANLFYCQEKQFIDLIFNNKSNFEILKTFKGKIPSKFLVLNETITFNECNFHLSKEELSEPEKSDEHSKFGNCYIFSNEKLDKLISEKEKLRLSSFTRKYKSKRLFPISNKNIKIIHNKRETKKFYFQVSETLYTENKEYAFVTVDIYNFNDWFVSKDDDGYYLFGYIIFIFKNNGDGKWNIIDKHERLIL